MTGLLFTGISKLQLQNYSTYYFSQKCNCTKVMDGFRSAELMLVLDLYNIYLFPFVSSIKNHKTAAYKLEQKLKKSRWNLTMVDEYYCNVAKGSKFVTDRCICNFFLREGMKKRFLGLCLNSVTAPRPLHTRS